MMRATQLRSEFPDHPLNSGRARPQLSWVLESDSRDQRQTAYRILVASSPEALKNEGADRWDSGKVDSDQSIHVEDSEKDKVVAKLAEAVEANGGKADFGILGTKYIPRVLADNGRVDLAYKLITQPEFPGWAHWLKQGATTLWESWNGESSRNHIMFGDISAWFYRALAGIHSDENQPGFKHFLLRPNVVGDLTWVHAEYRSPYGPIRSDWHVQDGALQWDILIPVNTTATVSVPAADASDVTEGQGPASEAVGVHFVRMERGHAIYSVESGSYRFLSSGLVESKCGEY